MNRKLLFCWIALLALCSCRERFEVEGIFKEKNFLVVEGFINIGVGSTQIKLSRVSTLNEPNLLIIENSAEVFIEDDQGSVYALHNRSNGIYESDELNLPLSNDYRIRIELEDKTYLSDYSTPLLSPPIDSVGWIRDRDNYINIHVSTHDPRNNTFYYKWEFEEVWEVRSTYVSRWAYEGGVSRIRLTDEINQMSYCWPRAYSSDLLFTSSEQLTTDAIRLFPLKRFYLTDPRLGWRYSISVKQRALSKAEYEFLLIMKKNTNNLGSFFDAQPSQLAGNIHCTSTNEPVVGYIGSYTSEIKQLVMKRPLISDFLYTTPCFFNQVNIFIEDPQFSDAMLRYLPLLPIYGPAEDDAPPIIGFSIAHKECTDCRVLSGTAPKPAFWIQEDEDLVD